MLTTNEQTDKHCHHLKLPPTMGQVT